MGNSTPLKPEGLYCSTGTLAIASALVRTTGVKVPNLKNSNGLMVHQLANSIGLVLSISSKPEEYVKEDL
ncbi:hypothetical protein NC651_029946 [Populus alba x Populus x berolinensis]|nr:hypothetical protein NC651_029946 [Populus alba x Populus x berolinensis]